MNRLLAFSTFASAKSPAAQSADATWADLVPRLLKLNILCGELASRQLSEDEQKKINNKLKEGPGYNFARLVPAHRANANVRCLAALVIDVDDGPAYEVLLPRVSHLEHVAYSTFQSTRAKPRYRLVFPLTRDVERSEWEKFWAAGNAFVGQSADQSAKDASRFYYFHSCAESNRDAAFAVHNSGKWLDPDALLSQVAPLLTAPASRQAPQQFPANDAFLAGLPDPGPDPTRVCGDGERTHHLTSLAGMWIAQGHGLDAVKLQAAQWNERNTPPLPLQKVYSTCEGMWRTHNRNHAPTPSATQAGALAAPPHALSTGGGPGIVLGSIDAIQPLFDLKSAAVREMLSATPPARRWLLRDCLPCGIVAAVVAAGGTGKSVWALQLAISVACGVPLAGVWHVDEPGPVVCLFAEDDQEELHRRLHAIVTSLRREGVLTADHEALLQQNLFIRSTVADNNLMTSALPNGQVVQLPYVQRLIATVAQAQRARLVIVDPASRFRGGSENAAEDTTRFIEALELVSKTSGANVVVLHHVNKGSLQGGEQSQSASRGSSAFVDGVRWVMNLSGLTEKEARTFGVPDEQRSRYLSASLTKSNYSSPQPTVYLRRGEGGCLSNAGLSIASDAKRNDARLQVLKKIGECKNVYSQHAFERKFGGCKNIFGVSSDELRGILNRGVEAGLIAKTEEGRKLPLSLTDEGTKVLTSVGAVCDLRSAQPAGDLR